MQDKQRIDSLRKKIAEHNHSYYVLDMPKISDFEFDLLLSELIELENKYPEFFDVNSPSQRVGGAVLEGFRTIKHLSLIHI